MYNASCFMFMFFALCFKCASVFYFFMFETLGFTCYVVCLKCCGTFKIFDVFLSLNVCVHVNKRIR